MSLTRTAEGARVVKGERPENEGLTFQEQFDATLLHGYFKTPEGNWDSRIAREKNGEKWDLVEYASNGNERQGMYKHGWKMETG